MQSSPAPEPRFARLRRQWPPSRRTTTILAIVTTTIVVLVLLWDWNWFKGPVERAVEARTGREFEIAGNFDVDPGGITTITADGVRLGNPDWSEQRDMATADRLALRLELWPLLRGSVRLAEIRLTRPDVRLEANPGDGPGNWDFGFDDGGEPLQVRRFWVDDGRLRFDDAREDTGIDIRLASREPRDGDAAPAVALSGDGRWTGNAFTLEGAAESPMELQDTERPYRLDLRARAGSTRAHARGTLIDPLRLRGLDLQFELAGRNLADLYPLFGVAMPDSPPYDVDGRLTRDGDTWHYDGFAGKVGQSDLAGSAALTVIGRERPLFEADLVSKRLDLDDLAGFLGGTPDADGEALDPELAAQAAAREARGKVLPSTPYDLGKLRAMDADVRLRAQRIDAPDLPIDDMDAHLLLEGGLARLQPLNFGVAGGDIRADIRMDARTDTITTRLKADVRRLELARLFPDVELTRDAAGRLAGSFNLVGTGNSVAAMLASADGDVAVGMGRGQISNLLIELAGIDIYEALEFLIGKDRKVAVRCAFADFGVERGVMRSRALAFDTSDTIIVGEGQVDLGDETLDIELRPRPKDRSILALRSPLHLGGTFADPSFRPDFARLGLRGAIALALGSIAPPAALLATLELGPGEDSDCGGSYAR
ncbi:AsmA family protein [Luteimonas viscosa]|uniref:AsmA family protein n=1 Tax=Luteimonas viscosa TaxID=1132694 RepID=A0A5D4XLY3_9GAMM|nr:AsmA family protein [Luteimonas viscosa]TYT25688.1 AsmA family protein [Luteimonas viscosa]